MIGDHLLGKGLVASSERAIASSLDWISNMSLMATSEMKSAVDGLTPNAEFTPIFSDMDGASAGWPNMHKGR
jgi:hypothetical protein